METLAYLGSANFFNDEISGQVNGVKARRSPGSALKPFAYALAVEQGLIHTQTMIKDAQTPFGTYTPDNFDRAFSGPLSAVDALIHSRNIPAIELCAKLKKPTLYDFLKTTGIPLNTDLDHYGLSLVLGTAEVTMEELSALYSIFNNNGKFSSIKKILSKNYAVTKDVSKNVTKKVLSAESAFLILDMLSKNLKPNEGSQSKWFLKPKSVAWKTGTSVGFRDAWSIGLFDHYVLAVWIGNFSGKGNPAFIGRNAAGPLLFALIDSFAEIKKTKFLNPLPGFDLNVNEINVCALSGQIPHKDCTNLIKSWYIPGVSPISKCKIHRRINIDPLTGFQVCPEFKGKRVSKVFEYWPTDLLKLFKKAGVGRKLPPKKHSSCLGERFGDIGPKIMSPKKNIKYYLRSEGSGSKNIPLIAVSDGNVKKHKWYINSKLIGQSSTEDPLIWKAEAGKHNVRVIDEQGRFSDVNVEVQWID